MFKKIFTVTTLFFCVALFFFSPPASADNSEKILSFHSDIVINEDSSIIITELIRVKAAGVSIKRGIYRDFPTKYKDEFGNKYVVGFEVLEVLKNGLAEDYHIVNMENGKRVYIGRKDVFISPGIYIYTIIYRTNRQLGFFKDHDELYWNVTGTGWSFPIDEASAVVTLPGGIKKDDVIINGFTGPQGSRGKNFISFIDDSGRVHFNTKAALRSYEGFTIVVGFSKGFVREPDFQTKAYYFIKDNIDTVSGIVGILILVIYYLFIWAKVGKDPQKGIIIPLYIPPDNISPAAARYIMKMGYDNKIFTSAIINMAVKGLITIKEKDGKYTLIAREKNEELLSPEEKKIYNKLLGSRDEITLENSVYMSMQNAIVVLVDSLKTKFEKVYFFTNKEYFITGVIISVAVMVLSNLAGGDVAERLPLTIFMSVWLTIWTIGLTFFLKRALDLWKMAVSTFGVKLKFLGEAILVSSFLMPFIAVEIFVIFKFGASGSVALIVIMFCLVFINFLFYHLLKASTLAGRKVMDKIEGFRMYLETAEKERLNLLNPPDETPELFEKYLPYALALDVEAAWAERFSEILQKAGEPKEGYRPVWYSGGIWDTSNIGGFATGLGNSFSSAIASSSTPPGSTSGGGGFSGGGSSGGGGGGGGGGGW